CGFGVIMDLVHRGYVDKSQVFSNGFSNDEYLDFIETILCNLPDTFEDRFYLFCGASLINNQLLIAEDTLYQVTLSDFDKLFSINIIATSNKQPNKLAYLGVKKTASVIFDNISKYYDIWSKGNMRKSVSKQAPSTFNQLVHFN
ncbi:MAG TPA: hypothetical protein PKC44_16315, partial [Agitococcus sp.]|nr:hypothetical protein [Agitococcus sp.]